MSLQNDSLQFSEEKKEKEKKTYFHRYYYTILKFHLYFISFSNSYRTYILLYAKIVMDIIHSLRIIIT